MRNLKLINGDLSFNNHGKLEFVSNLEHKIQSILLRLRTRKGDLFYNNEYGFPDFRGKITKEILENYFRDALLDDEDLRDVTIVEFNERRNYLERNNYDVKLNIELKDGTQFNLDYYLGV